MRLSRAVFASVLFAALLGFALRYGSLPPLMASHFGPSGRPDAWMSRSTFAWFLLLPIGVCLALTFASVLLARLPPAFVNLPNKDYWLAPERREATLRRFAIRMEWFGSVLLSFLAFVYELVIEANLSNGRLSGGAFVTALVAFVVFAIGWSVSLHRAFARPATR